MRWRASIGFALLALSHFAFANASSALAQAGSTGGTIGKQDKSISGGNTPERSDATTRKKPHRSIEREREHAVVAAGHRREKENREAPGSSREVRPSLEGTKTTINNTPTCSRAYAGCVRARSRFGKGIVRNCEPNFAKCKQTGAWNDTYSHFEGLDRR